jgi:hypothetical protein
VDGVRGVVICRYGVSACKRKVQGYVRVLKSNPTTPITAILSSNTHAVTLSHSSSLSLPFSPSRPFFSASFLATCNALYANTSST